MLLTFQGYFEAGQFITDTPVCIPEGRKAIVTITSEPVDKKKNQEEYRKRWEKIIHDIRTCDEVLEGMPERMRFFKTSEQLESL